MKKTLKLMAPVSGTVVALEDVQDEMFSKKMLGDGVAFRYDTSEVCAPADGEIAVVAATKHAVGLKLENGAEILIHIGMDTVNLNGKGFEALVKQGDHVKAGQPLIKLDRKVLSEANVDLTTPMVITNSSEVEYSFCQAGQKVKAGSSEVASVTHEMQSANNVIQTEAGGKYAALVGNIITNVGGTDNVISVTHCVTRLRFKLRDENKANTPKMESTNGVIQVIRTGGQYQVVVGTAVDDIYDEP